MKGIAIIASVIVIIGLIVIVISWPRSALSPTEQTPSTVESLPTPAQPLPTSADRDQIPESQTLQAAAIPNVAAAYQFSGTIPATWQAEAIPAIDAINIFDPAAPGDTSLEQSQIFIRTFSANDFLTLDTVTILNQLDLTINGRPAVEYRITREASAAPFPSQPSWRNQEHIVTDVRVADTNPSVFYVIAQRPDLNDDIYQEFLQSLHVIAAEADATLQEPIAEFQQRITKKPFGIFITPDTSPIQPERFTGYHTGVDVEYTDVADDVPVVAIADGTIRTATTATGYGGVTVVEHQIDGDPVMALYGHLEPESLRAIGASVQAGDNLGVLGQGNTSATDGERKHLHFALRRGTDIDLRGYVSQQNDLNQWIDPLTIF